MTGSIPDDKIQQMRDGVDIYELVSRYVQLKRSGASNYVGLCPFHAEKSPSFSVNPGRQIFKCFGCGVGGDAFEFLMRMEGLSFPEAARRIAGEMGIDIEERRLSPEEEQRRQEQDRLQRVNAIAAEFFHRQLLDAPEAEACRQYLNRRGYGRKSAAEYQLGFAPDRWDALLNHLQSQGVKPEDARALGLIRKRERGEGDYDLFRGRLIFPIHDLSGRIVAFGGRILGDGQPKYINSPESPIYHKGQLLFGLYGARQAIRQAGEVILVEGYFDQLALARAGVPNAVATCGTALTSEHAQLLKRYAKRVLLLFDADSAGRNATFKSMELLLPTGLEAAVITLEHGEDPDSFLQKQGREAFDARQQAAQPVLELYMRHCLAEAQPGVAGVSRAAQQVLQMLLLLPNPLEVDLSIKELARLTDIEVELLKQQFEQIGQEEKARQQRQERRQQVVRSQPERSPEVVPPPDGPPEEFCTAVPNGDLAPAPAKRLTKKISRADLLRLQMLIHEPVARQLIGADVANYFYDEQALELANKVLQALADVAPGGEMTRLQASPALLGDLPQPVAYDRKAYGDEDVIKATFEQARKDVEKARHRAKMKTGPSGIAD